MGAFDRLSQADLIEAPFPHLMLDDALPSEIVEPLMSFMPPPATLLAYRDYGHHRHLLPSHQALSDQAIDPRWRAALAACVTDLDSLLQGFVARMRQAMRLHLPGLEDRFGPPERWTARRRFDGQRARHEVGMDAQLVVNPPNPEGAMALRGPHIDKPDKLFAGLLYLRPPQDDSLGGELELCRPVRPGIKLDRVQQAEPAEVRTEITYKRRHNRLLLALNTPHSLHAVTSREPSPYPRYHIHLVAEMSGPLFRAPQSAYERMRGVVGSVRTRRAMAAALR